MITKHHLKQVKIIKELGVFSVSIEVDKEEPPMTSVSFGLKGDEEAMSIVGFDDDFAITVLETLELASYLINEKGI